MSTGFLIKIKTILLSREFLTFSPIYFFLSFINLRVKLLFSPAWFDGTLVHNHQLLLQFNYTNHEQSRLLQYIIPELFHKLLSLSIEHAYILQRWLFVFLAFICFHYYLRKWFKPSVSFAGVLFLASAMPLSYYGYLQESAPLLLLTFVLGLWAIRDNRLFALTLIFLVGGLNNETMLILPLAYFLYRFRSFGLKNLLPLIKITLIISLPLLLTVGLMKYLTWGLPILGGANHFYSNLSGITYCLLMNPFDYYQAGYLFVFFIFNVFWLYAFFQWKDKPLFLKRISLIIPIFIIIHLITGIFIEVRQMIPLSFIIIPMALFYLFSRKQCLNKL